jgi:hypothetical protein
MSATTDLTEGRTQVREWLIGLVNEALCANGGLEIQAPSETTVISCDEAGCGGCDWYHRKFTGKHELHLTWKEGD